MWGIVFRGLVGLTAAHLKGRKTVTAAELAEAMLKALEDMKDILRKQGLKVDADHGTDER
jgi:nucleotidyltransferase/DNA polymerase involved in DNA repair